MPDTYDFGNLSPIEFEALVADLLGEELSITFETFSEGADGGIDARYASAKGNIIVQAKHYKGSSWSDLETAAKKEHPKIVALEPKVYHFVTSQKLTPARKEALATHLKHPSVKTKNIRGLAELNALIKKHPDVEKRNLKLWLSSSAVLQRLLTNDIAVFTEATLEGISRILKVFVENPSLPRAAEILNKQHCLIVSGPPGVGKTTLAQVLAAEYCDDGWELVALNSIEDGHRAFLPDKKQVFIFDDFLGTIKLDRNALSRDDNKIAKFMELISGRSDKRFILTTRKYILQAARQMSEALDADRLDLREMVLNLDVYSREIKARILYNHLYHSGLSEEYLEALIEAELVREIVDHPHYMPRIVEWMTDHLRFEDTDPKEYPDKFMAALDNPRKIWEKPFRDHISQEARILLYCMYFSTRTSYWNTGFDITELKPFFENALETFSVSKDGSLSETRFQDALRELSSSFVVLQSGKVDFINPSVQDFLARQVDDTALLNKLAVSVPTFRHLAALWRAAEARFKNNKAKKSLLAKSILSTVLNNKVDGRIALESIAFGLGDMVLLSKSSEFIGFLRSGGLSSKVWINESELPDLIDELMFGRFSGLPHAEAYGRLLRIKLYKYLSDREFVLEVQELGMLADNLNMYREDLPECLHEAFEEAAEESIDSLQPHDVGSGNDPESTVSDWLEQIDKIDNYLGRQVNSWKRNELDEFMGAIQWEHEMEMERHKDEGGLRRSSAARTGLPTPVAPSNSAAGPKGGFSDVHLASMFASLRK